MINEIVTKSLVKTMLKLCATRTGKPLSIGEVFSGIPQTRRDAITLRIAHAKEVVDLNADGKTDYAFGNALQDILEGSLTADTASTVEEFLFTLLSVGVIEGRHMATEDALRQAEEAIDAMVQQMSEQIGFSFKKIKVPLGQGKGRGGFVIENSSNGIQERPEIKELKETAARLKGDKKKEKVIN